MGPGNDEVVGDDRPGSASHDEDRADQSEFNWSD
jgi:hypothetical protein